MNSLVMISAPWCNACHALADTLEQLQWDFGEEVIKYTVLDIEKNPEYVDLYQINSVPVLLFKNENGEVVEQFVGTMNAKNLLKHFGSTN